ncbi:MAG: Rieske 2Fe-2S domain-containing protein [Thermoplasmataceae archaeon]
MADKPDVSRRNFLKTLVGLSAVAAVGGLGKAVVQNVVPPSVGLSSFPETVLYWVPPGSSGGTPVPVKASLFPVNSPNIWIYYYPLTDDPNFLINLGNSSNVPQKISPVPVTIDATGQIFESPGGAGPNGSIVSFSAICQHLGCVPPIIRYYPPNQLSTLSSILPGPSSDYPNGVIHCNCHGSTYDPSKGAGIITHPTYKPLPNVILAWDPSTDTLAAKNMNGPTIYGKSSDLSGGTPLSNLQKTLMIQMSVG